MTELLKRLFRIARSGLPHSKTTPTGNGSFEESDSHRQDGPNQPNREQNRPNSTESNGRISSHSGLPRQVIEDLALFNLEPPVTLDEIRRARNREIKKYHSDKFIHDQEKLETSKEIMQIYNAAYERLEKYYPNIGPS